EAIRFDSGTPRPLSDPRGARGARERRVRPHPHRAEERVDQTVHGADGHRRDRAALHARRDRAHRRLRDARQRADGEHRRAPAAHGDGETARRGVVRRSRPARQDGDDRRDVRRPHARRHRQGRRPVAVHSVNRPSTGAGRALVLFAALAVGCGKKGPPLPPLVRLPIAPPTIAAERIGDTVAVTFTVPDTNTDRTKPANIDRVDVYAITAPPSISDAQLLKHATKIGSVAVKSPKDPNAVVDEDEQDEEMEPAVGAGLDQGAVAHVDEQLTRQAFVNADLASDDRKRPAPATDAPLVGPPTTLPARTYVAVGVSARGKKGPLSKRVTAPLIEPPATPRDLRLS